MKIVEGGRFAVKKAVMPGVGDGLFAVLPVSAGEFILEYTGELVPTGSAEATGSRYLFVLDEEWTIDGPAPDNIAGYVNHACEPNCEARAEDGRIMFYALRDIESGEELTIDYGPEYFETFIKSVGCKCTTCIQNNVKDA